MKKKHWKILALAAAFALIAGLAWFANALNGNPISKMLARHTAERHLAETYAGTDYYIERVGYSFKDGNYYAFIKSPTSMDTEFSLRISMLGELRLDTYDDVLNGFNTARRLEQGYRELTDTVFEDPSFPYGCSIAYGTLEICPEELIGNGKIDGIPAYAINQNELVLDKLYDLRDLGRQAGHLVIYVEGDAVTLEAAADMMVAIKGRFDAAGIPFAAMDFTLRYPRPEEGRRPEGEIRAADFPYSEIYEAGMTDRVKEADKALKAYYAEMDAVKQQGE